MRGTIVRKQRPERGCLCKGKPINFLGRNITIGDEWHCHACDAVWAWGQTRVAMIEAIPYGWVKTDKISVVTRAPGALQRRRVHGPSAPAWFNHMMGFDDEPEPEDRKLIHYLVCVAVFIFTALILFAVFSQTWT